VIFVDTGAWFALAVAEDPDHEAAMEFLEANTRPLVTSEMVVVETMNLIRFRGRDRRALDLACAVGDDLWNERAATLWRTGPEDIDLAREIFRGYADKRFSFTDCTSFALMQNRGVTHAFAFDHHFDQYPGIERLPVP